MIGGLVVMGVIGVCGVTHAISENMSIKQTTKDYVEIVTSTVSKTAFGGTLIYCVIQVVKAFIELG